jgi:twinkle protein
MSEAITRGAEYLDSLLAKGGKIIADDLMLSKFETPTEADFVKPASMWLDEVIDHFHAPKGVESFGMGWEKTRELIDFRPGEVTEWFGYNGHGKSAFTSQVALNFLADYQRVCIASFEMRPSATIGRMARMASGEHKPSKEFLRDFCSWLDGKLWIYDVHGSVKAHRVLACGRYAASLGVRHFFIDSLMKCIRGADDYNGQKDFVGDLCALAKETQQHIHLIHHARKGDEGVLPRKDDAKGAGEIADQVDNQIVVWLNKKKFDAQESGMSYDPDEPDAVVKCYKQRNGDHEPKFMFWMHRASMQYIERRNDPARRYFGE